MIEIMISFSILVLVFIFLAQSFPTGYSINKSSQRASLASYLAQEKIEELFALGYDNIATGTIETKAPLSNDPNNYLNNYSRETIVNYVDGNLNSTTTDQGLKKVRTTVYYSDPISNNEESLTLTTIINKY